MLRTQQSFFSDVGIAAPESLRHAALVNPRLVEAVSDYVQNNPGVLPFEENEAREMLQRVSESAP